MEDRYITLTLSLYTSVTARANEVSEVVVEARIPQQHPILSLSTGAGDGVLLFRGPGDKVPTKENCITGGGTTCVGAANPIGIRVHYQLTRRGGIELQAKINCASNIPENPLHCCEVSFPGIMHVKADLLNYIGNIRSGEGEILQGTSKAAKLRSINDRRTIIISEFLVSVHQCGARLALSHGGRSRMSNAYCF